MLDSTKTLRIAFVSSYDPRNKRVWSGIPYYSAKALAEHCGEVDLLGPYPYSFLYQFFRGLSYLARKITGHRLDQYSVTLLSKLYGSYFTKKLKKGTYDLIFTASGSAEIAYLKTDIPIVILADTTFANMIDYYPEYTNLLSISKKMAWKTERKAFEKASLLLFSSEWAANSAKEDYHIDPEKIYTIPLGANLDSAPSHEKVLSKKKTDTSRLLSLAVNWERKGGKIAFQTLLELKKRGIKTSLTVIGCVPPSDFHDPDLIVIPFLNKNKPDERVELEHQLLQADFLILPTRAECYGIVFAEASAYGLPIITTATGGIAGAVKEGVNGFMLPLAAGGNVYAEKIAEIFNSDEQYYSMVANCRDLYEEKLNWNTWAAKLKEVCPVFQKT